MSNTTNAIYKCEQFVMQYKYVVYFASNAAGTNTQFKNTKGKKTD